MSYPNRMNHDQILHAFIELRASCWNLALSIEGFGDEDIVRELQRMSQQARDLALRFDSNHSPDPPLELHATQSQAQEVIGDLCEALDNAMRLLRDTWKDNPHHPIWTKGPAALAKARGLAKDTAPDESPGKP